jgi:hypothetical protein
VDSAFFYTGSLLKADVEDTVYRWCILISLQVGTKFCVVLVKSTNAAHHRNNSMPFANGVIVFEHLPELPATPSA